MEKMLILRKHGSIGDMLMMTPALQEVSKNSELGILVPDEYKEVFFNLPYIRNIYSLNSPVNSSAYEKTIDLTNFEFNYEQVLQPEISKTKMEIFGDALNVKITRNCPEIVLTERELEWISNYLKNANLKNGKIILLGIKTKNPTRDWPLDKWKALIAKLKKLNYNLIVVDKNCSWDDKDLTFFNNHSIRELFALVSKADFVICNDSGLLHIAGAFEKITLGIFGPTDPKMRAVYKNSFYINNNLGITPCWYNRSKEMEYFKTISPEDVERKFLEVLQNEEF